MKKQLIQYLSTSLAIIACISAVPQSAMAETASNDVTAQIAEESSFLSNKDKEKDKDKSKHEDGIFNEENLKYLSSDQKKQLKELKACRDSGKKLSEEQEKTLHSLVDCIIKGKLGEEKYKDFKCLMEKKRSGTELTEAEHKKLKEYRKMIHGSKECSTTNEILKQFLR